jgi:hypothetical protein
VIAVCAAATSVAADETASGTAVVIAVVNVTVASSIFS